MFKVVTQYKATGVKGGYVLQWESLNTCPSYIVGKNKTCGWYKYKKDAVNSANNQNKQFNKV
jgi:hypothetical protein